MKKGRRKKNETAKLLSSTSNESSRQALRLSVEPKRWNLEEIHMMMMLSTPVALVLLGSASLLHFC